MRQRALLTSLLLVLLALPAAAREPEEVSIPPLDKRDPVLSGLLFRPATKKPAPAIVMLHGCDGMYRKKDGTLNSRGRDWSARFVEQGYVVLLPDSFGARDVESACSGKELRARARVERVRDLLASLAFLREQRFVRSDSLGVAGWSHGGSTVLATIDKREGLDGLRQAIVFYPNCKPEVEKRDWQARVPVALFVGDSDEWAPLDQCRQLTVRHRLDLVVYPGAVHGFDTPGLAHTTITGVSTPSGTARQGTDPVARADAIQRVTARFLTTLKP
jgi:dienelactone hydrolase